MFVTGDLLITLVSLLTCCTDSAAAWFATSAESGRKLFLVCRVSWLTQPRCRIDSPRQPALTALALLLPDPFHYSALVESRAQAYSSTAFHICLARPKGRKNSLIPLLWRNVSKSRRRETRRQPPLPLGLLQLPFSLLAKRMTGKSKKRQRLPILTAFNGLPLAAPQQTARHARTPLVASPHCASPARDGDPSLWRRGNPHPKNPPCSLRKVRICHFGFGRTTTHSAR